MYRAVALQLIFALEAQGTVKSFSFFQESLSKVNEDSLLKRLIALFLWVPLCTLEDTLQ